MEMVINGGFVTTIDEKHLDLFSQWSWSPSKSKNTIYVHGYRKPDEKEYLHRLIVQASGINIKGLMVDHKDENGLNNLEENLRIITKSQNQINRGLPSNNTSGYKGVNWHKASQKWRTRIGYNNKRIYLGSFSNLKDAARAYNKMASKLFKQFAWLNEID